MPCASTNILSGTPATEKNLRHYTPLLWRLLLSAMLFWFTKLNVFTYCTVVACLSERHATRLACLPTITPSPFTSRKSQYCHVAHVHVWPFCYFSLVTSQHFVVFFSSGWSRTTIVLRESLPLVASSMNCDLLWVLQSLMELTITIHRILAKSALYSSSGSVILTNTKQHWTKFREVLGKSFLIPSIFNEQPGELGWCKTCWRGPTYCTVDECAPSEHSVCPNNTMPMCTVFSALKTKCQNQLGLWQSSETHHVRDRQCSACTCAAACPFGAVTQLGSELHWGHTSQE